MSLIEDLENMPCGGEAGVECKKNKVDVLCSLRNTSSLLDRAERLLKQAEDVLYSLRNTRSLLGRAEHLLKQAEEEYEKNKTSSSSDT